MIKYDKVLDYDNCKGCKSKCEHAGKDREFVYCGTSCKVVYTHDAMRKAAADFVAAIKEIAGKPQNLDNLESYLTNHFPEWLSKHANTPESMAAEMREFAKMDV